MATEKHIGLRTVFVFLVMMPATRAVFAQDGTFTASVEQNKVATGEQFELTLTLNGDPNASKNFKPPDFNPFLVLAGPSTSTNIQFVNGRMSASMTYSYTLYARQTGKFTIGAATIEYKGTTLKTQPVQMEVVQGKPQAQQQQQGGQSQQVANIENYLFVKAIPDKQRVVVGEQVIVSYKLFKGVEYRDIGLEKNPTFEGFWNEEFELPKQQQPGAEVVNGVRYQTFLIKKVALFAQQPGKCEIAPIELQAQVLLKNQRRSNDPFDIFNDPFFSQYKTANVKFKSNPVTITVAPLPANAPASFSGAVGKYNFAAAVDKKSVKAGDAITLKIAISGTGNIKLVAPPKPTLPTDIESYDPKISEEITRDAGVVRGKKMAEYLLIPRNQGERAIEPLVFTYFDLDKRQYVSMRSPKFEFSIAPGKDFSASSVTLASKEDVRVLGEDIRFLKLQLGSLQGAGETPTSSTWFLLAMILPPFAFIGAVAYRKRLEKIYGDMPSFRAEKAGREAAKRLRAAKGLLAKGNTEQYHAEISKALTQYLEHKLRMPKASFTMDDAEVRLGSRGVTDEAVATLKDCLDRAEFARFAPSADTQEARQELLNIAADSIDAVEKSYRKK